MDNLKNPEMQLKQREKQKNKKKIQVYLEESLRNKEDTIKSVYHEK